MCMSAACGGQKRVLDRSPGGGIVGDCEPLDMDARN